MISLSNYRFFFVFDGWFFFFLYDPRFVFSFLSPKMVWTAIRSGSLRETTKSVRFSFWNLVFIGFVFDRRRSDGIVEPKKKSIPLVFVSPSHWVMQCVVNGLQKKMDFWPMVCKKDGFLANENR